MKKKQWRCLLGEILRVRNASDECHAYLSNRLEDVLAEVRALHNDVDALNLQLREIRESLPAQIVYPTVPVTQWWTPDPLAPKWVCGTMHNPDQYRTLSG